MMHVGIVAALNTELRPLSKCSLHPQVVERRSDQLSLIVSGIGAENARAAGQKLLAQGATALLSWGCAAALDGRLKPGCPVLPDSIIAADGIIVPVYAAWRERVHDKLSTHLSVTTGRLAESPAILADAAAKRALFQRHNAVAADMESAALGKLAVEADVPFLVIRVIADSATMAIPDSLISVLRDCEFPHPARLAAAILRHPGAWPDLAKLAWSFRAAKATLAQVAQCLDEQD